MGENKMPKHFETTAAQVDQGDRSLAALDSLIERYAAAAAAEEAALEAIPQIEPAICRVQIGRQLVGVGDDGDSEYEPVWAYVDDHIDRKAERDMKAALVFWGSTEEKREKIRSEFGEWAATKKRDLAEIWLRRRLAVDEAGVPAALQAVDRATEALMACMAEVVDFVQASLPAAARKASWLAAELEREASPLQIKDAREALRAIAAAWA
jgi:hypothetical protein